MELKGKCISIRPITEEDTDCIVKWRNEEFVKSNFIYQNEFTRSGHLNWFHNKVETKEVYQFIIIENSTLCSIGSIYLRDIDLNNNKAEYGIFIGEKDALGKGYGTEAGLLLLSFAFQNLNLHKVYLRVFAHNKQAVASYKKVGFLIDGIFRDDVKIKDEYYDMIFMSILEGDYYENN